MILQPNQPLLHYRLIAKLGEGGMGQVWRARDTTLDRDVAVKLLPHAFAEDVDRLARFEREAKLLASLNHPQIAGVYGLHQADTADGPLRFICMELIEGEDLSERLARGPMTPERALEVASQIAEALSAAHEAGVIHRDLKPENIKLTAEGKVKVLDFGLAKALDPTAASGDASLTTSPTRTSAGTMAGVIMGTASYMSPEQARGKPTDRRTDMWAFGAVLYQMLSGRMPFPGEVISEVMAKVLERDPDWDLLPTPLHPGIRRLLERCLTKNPARRLRDAADAKIEIDDLLLDPTGKNVTAPVNATADMPGAPAIAAPTQPTHRSWSRVVPWVLVAALLVWAVAATMKPPPPPPTADALVHFEINPPIGYQFNEFSVAPDGSAIAVVASNREAARSLWIRRLDATGHRQLPGTDDAWFPFWSPDSRKVGFFSRGKLRTVDVATGAIQSVADAPNGRGAAWGADDTILFTPDGAEALLAVAASGGTPRAVTTLKPPTTSHRFPHFIAGTRTFTFTAQPADVISKANRYLGSLDSSEVRLLEKGLSETYVPPGYALTVREDTLLAQPFDAADGELSGTPAPLAQQIDDAFPRTGRASFSVSDNGVLAYLTTHQTRSRVDAYDRDGRRLETVVPGGLYQRLKPSRDRTQMLFTRTSGDESSLWLMDLRRSSVNRLLHVQAAAANVAWSADEQSFVYSVRDQLDRVSFVDGASEKLMDGSTGEHADELDSLTYPSVSPDGRYIAFSTWHPVSDFDLWLLPLTGDRIPVRLSDANGPQYSPAISPDGCWLAYDSIESGRFEVYVRSVGEYGRQCPPSGRARLISVGGGSAPIWNSDGTELLYVAPDYGIMATKLDKGRSGKGFKAGVPERLFIGPLSVEDNADIFFRQPTLVAVDGDRFLFHVADEEVRDRTIQIVMNWERLLPE